MGRQGFEKGRGLGSWLGSGRIERSGHLQQLRKLYRGGIRVSIYLSMQRVRFSSASGYEKFKNIFADVRQHLKSLLGFLHLTW